LPNPNPAPPAPGSKDARDLLPAILDQVEGDFI